MPAIQSRNKNKHRAQAVNESDDERSTPTLQVVQRLPRMDQLVISTEDGRESETIEANDWYPSHVVLHLFLCSHVMEVCSLLITRCSLVSRMTDTSTGR